MIKRYQLLISTETVDYPFTKNIKIIVVKIFQTLYFNTVKLILDRIISS